MARPGLFSHRKFRKLSRLLKSDALAVGHLELIWHAAYEDGEARLGGSHEVESAARWEGEPGVLIAALVDSGFVDDLGGDQFEVHDLWDHAPEYIQRRAEREAQRRAKGQTISDVRRAAARVRWDASDVRLQSKCNANAMQTAPLPAHAPSTRTSTQHSDSSAMPEDRPAKPPVLVFPTVGKGPKTWDLTPEQVGEWIDLYPGVPVETECRHALAWIKANSPKTAGGMTKFLVAWLGRANNGRGRLGVARETVEEHNKRAGEEWLRSKGVKV